MHCAGKLPSLVPSWQTLTLSRCGSHDFLPRLKVASKCLKYDVVCLYFHHWILLLCLRSARKNFHRIKRKMNENPLTSIALKHSHLLCVELRNIKTRLELNINMKCRVSFIRKLSPFLWTLCEHDFIYAKTADAKNCMINYWSRCIENNSRGDGKRSDAVSFWWNLNEPRKFVPVRIREKLY